MADIFTSCDAARLLRGKKIICFGDSNMRALYKDFLCLLTGNRLVTETELKGKYFKSFLGDTLLRGSPLTKGRSYKEDRLYKANNFHIEFHFITKCLNEDVEQIFMSIKNQQQSAPDIIIMNSTLWDIARWGAKGVDLFKDNMMSLMRLLQACIPSSTLVIWVTVPPVASITSGGFYIKQIEFTKYTMRFDVMQANMFAQQVFASHGYDLIDFHYNLRMSVHWRDNDGLHWMPKALRHMLNLVLTHVSLAWGESLPGNYSTSELSKYKELNLDHTVSPIKLPEVPLLNITPNFESTSNTNFYSHGRSSQQHTIGTRIECRKKKKPKRKFPQQFTPPHCSSVRTEENLIHNNNNWYSSQGFSSEEKNPGVDGNWTEDYSIEGSTFQFSEDCTRNFFGGNIHVQTQYLEAPHESESYHGSDAAFRPVRNNMYQSQHRFTPY